MNTVQDKAEKWLDTNVPGWTADQLRSLVTLLREQDRDTRHACAEAVIQHGDAPAIEMIDRCHAACMNAKAI